MRLASFSFKGGKKMTVGFYEVKRFGGRAVLLRYVGHGPGVHCEFLGFPELRCSKNGSATSIVAHQSSDM